MFELQRIGRERDDQRLIAVAPLDEKPLRLDAEQVAVDHFGGRRRATAVSISFAIAVGTCRAADVRAKQHAHARCVSVPMEEVSIPVALTTKSRAPPRVTG